MILTIRTDKPEAEIGLYDQLGQQRAYKKWQAHRELGESIHLVMKNLLDSLHKDWNDITGVVYYRGPGSFTGLRIGASVANAIAISNNLSISAQNGQDWIEDGVRALGKGLHGSAIPEYGSLPNITKQKK